MMVYGELFVAVAGTDLMQMLFADSLGFLALVSMPVLPIAHHHCIIIWSKKILYTKFVYVRLQKANLLVPCSSF